VPTEAWIEPSIPVTKLFSIPHNSQLVPVDVDIADPIDSRNIPVQADDSMTNNQEPVTEVATDRTNTSTADSGHSKEAAPTPVKGAVTTRSGTTTKRPNYLDEYVTYEIDVANTRRSDTIVACTDYMDPVLFMLTGNYDNFYYHEILREPGKSEFIKQ
jgi:hypothetical protein